jgi:hypothetical protein
MPATATKKAAAITAALVGLTALSAPAASATVPAHPTRAHAVQSCGATWPAYPDVWTPQKGSCSVWGHPGYELRLTFSADNPTSLQVKAGKNGKWYRCGAQGSCTIPWGNQAADIYFRARALQSASTITVNY